MSRIEKVIFHWSVTSQFTGVKDIDEMHRAKGWRMIGYHRVILHPKSHEHKSTPDFWWDLVKQGRDLDDDLFIEPSEVGAHALGYNGKSVGVCVIGHPSYKLHDLQKEAIKQTAHILCARFKLPVTAICGHRDVNATACPGPEIYQLVQEIKKG